MYLARSVMEMMGLGDHLLRRARSPETPPDRGSKRRFHQDGENSNCNQPSAKRRYRKNGENAAPNVASGARKAEKKKKKACSLRVQTTLTPALSSVNTKAPARSHAETARYRQRCPRHLKDPMDLGWVSPDSDDDYDKWYHAFAWESAWETEYSQRVAWEARDSYLESPRSPAGAYRLFGRNGVVTACDDCAHSKCICRRTTKLRKC
eukprot:GEMP01066995.1.p1 GENE.GEMP01066995.1~~GEMP01066995.1.p1  ORF type:complete len:207 (-),score=51.21 GEMP01066995.1:593-1213(-)